MGTVRSADGTTITYDRAGSGPPLILVDGALCSRSFGPTAKLAARLATDFTVINYDRRGRGESTDTAPYEIARELDDLDALITEAGGSAYVFGASSGAALALDAAARNSGITKLALYEPPFVVDDSYPPMAEGFLATLQALIAADRRGDGPKPTTVAYPWD